MTARRASAVGHPTSLRRHTQSRRAAMALAAVLGAGAALPAAAGPITFSSALPLAADEFVLREQIVFARASDDPSPARRDLQARALVSVLGYGVTPRLAVFGFLPWRSAGLEAGAAGARATREASGIGDLRLFGRYTLLQRDRRGQSLRIAPFAGLEAPTGDDDERDALGRVPAVLQPGSGAWDGLAGVAVTWQTLAWELDAQLAYQANGEGNRFQAGDVVRLDASAQVRLWPRRLGSGVPGFLYGVLELNVSHQQHDRLAGRQVAASGGERVFITPGVQYVTRRWVAEAAVQVPVLQDLNGQALERDYVALVGFRVNF